MSAFGYMTNAQINLPCTDEERDPNEIRSNIIMGCIDGDNVLDSMYYNFQNQAIVVLLSTHNFEPIYLDYIPITSTEIGIGKGGFYESQNYMRRFVIYGYEYETSTGKFRLVGCYDEYLGNVTNDASGTSFLDLTAGRFVGDWSYWDSELGLLVSMPTVEAKIKNEAIYFDNNESELYFPIDSIFNYHKREAIVKDRIARGLIPKNY